MTSWCVYETNKTKIMMMNFWTACAFANLRLSRDVTYLQKCSFYISCRDQSVIAVFAPKTSRAKHIPQTLGARYIIFDISVFKKFASNFPSLKWIKSPVSIDVNRNPVWFKLFVQMLTSIVSYPKHVSLVTYFFWEDVRCDSPNSPIIFNFYICNYQLITIIAWMSTLKIINGQSLNDVARFSQVRQNYLPSKLSTIPEKWTDRREQTVLQPIYWNIKRQKAHLLI